MALANGVRFIWLDTHIGQDGEYHEFKRMFRTALDPTTVMPPDHIDSLICALNENAAPFLFADTIEKAIELIETHQDKKILFISSGILGKEIIPRISSTYPWVHSFYIFCAIVTNYLELVCEYRSCLQVFNNEIDLLVRLTRDISQDIINQGKAYMNLNEPKNALKCFESARILNETANTIDTLNDPFLEHLRILNNHGGNIGLIQQARDMLNQQPPHPTDDEQLSQQESQEP
jgi:hypothetical protein